MQSMPAICGQTAINQLSHNFQSIFANFGQPAITKPFPDLQYIPLICCKHAINQLTHDLQYISEFYDQPAITQPPPDLQYIVQSMASQCNISLRT